MLRWKSSRKQPNRGLRFRFRGRCGRCGWPRVFIVERLEPRTLLAAVTPAEAAAVAAGLGYLNQRMDEYHTAFEVYRDISSAGNHFHGRQLLPDETAAVTMAGSWTQDVYEGATSIRFEFQNRDGSNYGGYYLQNGFLGPTDQAPQLNFGQVPGAGVDLRGATALSLKVKGTRGGEQIEFFHGGIGRDPVSGAPTTPYPDSSPRFPGIGVTTTLSNSWQTIQIPLQGLDLSYTLGWGWIANAPSNPQGAVFFVDDVKYVLSETAALQRLAEPRFVQSFNTLPVQPDLEDGNPDDDIDLVLRNGASSYDNAVLVLTYLAEGSPDSLRRAKLIGEAFLRAIDHDRSFDNGAIRKFYMAGDISLPPGWQPNGRTGTVPIPGFYLEETQSFVEVEQDALDVGSNAWVTIALLGLYRRTGETRWLDAAQRIGEFVLQFRQDTGLFQGYRGGLQDPEGAEPRVRPYAATEHQIDVVAAARVLYAVTGDPKWQDAEQHARQFVDQMLDQASGCRFTGTTDPNTRNETPSQLPLDTQSWFVLAMPDAADHLLQGALRCAEQQHQVQVGDLSGFDFNTDRDGVWLEGTAQMALAYAAAGESQNGDFFLQQLIQAQSPPGQGSAGALFAATRDGLTTGFDFKYFRREHVAAVGWAIMSWLDFNPFYQSYVTLSYHNRSDPADVNRDSVVVPFDALLIINRLNAEGPSRLAKLSPPELPIAYWDTNGDDFMTPIDALLVINRLNSTSRGEGESDPAVNAQSVMERKGIGTYSAWVDSVLNDARARQGVSATQSLAESLSVPVANGDSLVSNVYRSTDVTDAAVSDRRLSERCPGRQTERSTRPNSQRHDEALMDILATDDPLDVGSHRLSCVSMGALQ